jgi:hypothetical protein
MTTEPGRQRRPYNPIDDDGATTQDLRDRFLRASNPDPAPVTAADQALRVRGAWMIRSGIVVIALALVIAIVWYAGFSEHIPSPFLMPLYGAGFTAITLGSLEYLNRPTRETHQRVVARLDRIERGLTSLVDLLPEELAQRWYAGYIEATKESLQRTGTDHYPAKARGTADVIKIQRRNGQPR